MTEGGIAVLRALRDGEARTVSEIASRSTICERKTRGALTGALVAGLVEQTITDARRFSISEAGLAEILDLPFEFDLL